MDLKKSSLKAQLAEQVQKIVMLSGDNQRTASAIAKKAGIDEAHGDLLPDQKIERVKSMLSESRYVGMIGEGANDAPAMAAASVGIAMGGAGTDTAIETADMALMQDDLSKVAEAIQLGPAHRPYHPVQHCLRSRAESGLPSPRAHRSRQSLDVHPRRYRRDPTRYCQCAPAAPSAAIAGMKR